MKVGDLVRVRYRERNDLNDVEWTKPFHGVIFETPDMGENCVWKMWCIERGKVHIIAPRKDSIEVISEINISD
jgi:hypothetical protein